MVDRLSKRTKGHNVGNKGIPPAIDRSPETLKRSAYLFKNKLAAENISDVYDHLIKDAN